MLGELSWGLFELEYMTLREIFNARKAHVREIEYQKRVVYESMRLQTTYLLNIHLPRAKTIKRPSDLFTFDWEKKKDDQIMTREEIIKFQRERIKTQIN